MFLGILGLIYRGVECFLIIIKNRIVRLEVWKILVVRFGAFVGSFNGFLFLDLLFSVRGLSLVLEFFMGYIFFTLLVYFFYRNRGLGRL